MRRADDFFWVSEVVEDVDEQDALPVLAAPGTAVVACGSHDDGAPHVAIWHVNPKGVPTGAWLVPVQEALTTKAAARKLLALVERRAITGCDPDAALEIVRDLVKVAELAEAGEWWTPAQLRPVDVFAQIVDRRAAYEKTVKLRQAESKSITDLDWRRDFPSMPADFEALRALAEVARPVGTAVIAEALTVARVLRWLVRLWMETEQVKGRRKYVREQHGDPEALPPEWLATVRAAAANRITW